MSEQSTWSIQTQSSSPWMPAPRLPLKRACACGNHTAGGECKTCRKQRTVTSLQRATADTATGGQAPPSVHEVLRSPGHSLDASTRLFMEPRFGHDFSRVRVHTDERAAESARAVHALAYTVGKDVVFGPGQYNPKSNVGRRLLAHELAHVVQQDTASYGPTLALPAAHRKAAAEEGARLAAERAAAGGTIAAEMVGQAAYGIYAQEAGQPEERRPELDLPPLRLSWDEFLQPGAFQLPPPTLQPGFRRPGLGVPQLRPPSLGLGPAPGVRPTSPAFQFPSGPQTPAPAATPAAPSRLTVLSSGRFSLGLRLGFPEPEEIPGAPPSAAQESLRRAEIMNQVLTGNYPQGWDAIDKGLLARAVWGIFSTHIAPDFASRLASSLSGSTGPAGPQLQFDLVLLGDFSGGGISFTIRH